MRVWNGSDSELSHRKFHDTCFLSTIIGDISDRWGLLPHCAIVGRASWFGIITLIGLSGCSSSTPTAPSSGPVGAKHAALVRVAPVVVEEVSPETKVIGTVVARRTSIVASGSDGKVDLFEVREGDIVEADQLLSVLNMVTTDLGIQEAEKVLQERQSMLDELQQGSRPEEKAEAKARMEAAEVTMRITAEKYERMRRIVRDSGGSQNELDDARERAEAAQKMFQAATAQAMLVISGPRAEVIAQAEARRDAQQNQVAFLKAEKEKRQTRAPFAGIVVQESTQRGQWLAKGDPVVTLADILDEVHVIANVDQRDLSLVQVGSIVDLEIDATTQRGWQGTVIAVVPRSQWESGSRTFPVKIAVKNILAEAGNRRFPILNEGMFARVTLRGAKRPATLVSKDAVIRSEAGSRLFVMLEDSANPGTGKAKPIPLQEGAFFGHQVEVLESELQAGMQVVVEGAERLQPYSEIQVLPEDSHGQSSPAGTTTSAISPETKPTVTEEATQETETPPATPPTESTPSGPTTPPSSQ